MFLVDSHCHLDFPDFSADLEGILKNAREAGVGLLLTIGTKLSTFDGVLALADRYDNVYCTVGIHPHEAAHEPPVTAGRLIELARHPKVVGFGESGLDYFYDLSPRAAQIQNFRVHLDAARESGLPIVVHTRDAEDDTAAILTEEYAKGPFKGLLHCFSSQRQLAETALSIGFYISFSGVLTFKRSDELRAIARDIPADRLLVETDAPFLAPIPKRGRRNEPAFVVHTAKAAAQARGIPMADLAARTTRNFLTLFDKVPALK